MRLSLSQSHLRAIFVIACAAAPALAATPGRQTLNFDPDWRFIKGDPTGNIDPSSHAFIDTAWRTLSLPHDWSIEGPFDEHAPTDSAGAYLPSGIAWYRKTFTLPPEAKGKRVFIDFDGVMANSDVYINKAVLGHRPNGNIGFEYELTDYLAPTGPNVIAVRTDTSRQPAARWYTGAGIYRHVRLIIQDPVHIEHWSTVITTQSLDADRASLHITTNILNQSSEELPAILNFKLLSPDGKTTVASASFDPHAKAVNPLGRNIAGGQSAEFTTSLTVDKPAAWSPDSPTLYHLVTSVQNKADGPVIDEETTDIGIRTAEFKADSGFYLNGKNIKLLGVCLHQDAGALGTAVPASAWETRLAALKSRGVNAIRTAHNPPSPEFLNACDKLGLLVMDEAFDAWTVGKEIGDYHLYFKDWWQRDLESMIKRDRNHPSIVIYSLGNEIWDILPQNPDPAPDQFVGPMRSIDIAKNLFIPMRDLAHKLDDTRPVTLAEMRPNVAGAYTNGFADLMDVIGQNYRDNELAAAHKDKPERKILGTEDYKTRETWIALRDNPALAGQFLWAGVDYLGEAGRWPNVVSPSGILDRTNFPKGEALERESWWSPTAVLHIVRMQQVAARPGRPNVSQGFADWTPANQAAHDETVNVYSNAASVELFLNDKSLGTKDRDPMDNPRTWTVPFAAGKLVAHGMWPGKSVPGTTASTMNSLKSDELTTAGPAAKIVLTAERTKLPNDFDDVVYIRAAVADATGITNPNADTLIKFTLTGPGIISAVDNGDVKSHESFQSHERTTYRGTCIAILHATADTGTITLTATADTLTPGTVTLEATPPNQ